MTKKIKINIGKDQLLNSFLPLEDQLKDAAKKDLKHILQLRKDNEMLSNDFYKNYHKFLKSNPNITKLIEINNIDTTASFPSIVESIIRDSKDIAGDEDGFVFDFGDWNDDECDFDIYSPNNQLLLMECFKNTFEVFKRIWIKSSTFEIVLENQGESLVFNFEKERFERYVV